MDMVTLSLKNLS